MKKRLYALAVTLLLLLLTAGCAENVQLIETDSGFFGESKKPEPISIPPDAELVEVTPTPQAEEAGRLVYLILPTETGLSLREKEIITETLGASDITVEVRTHEYEAETQSQLFLEAIEAGADLILCDNADPDTTVADVTAAYEAEVPVILMNRGTMSIGSASGQLVTDRFSCMGKLIEVLQIRSSVRPIQYGGFGFRGFVPGYDVRLPGYGLPGRRRRERAGHGTDERDCAEYPCRKPVHSCFRLRKCGRDAGCV